MNSTESYNISKVHYIMDEFQTNMFIGNEIPICPHS